MIKLHIYMWKERFCWEI